MDKKYFAAIICLSILLTILPIQGGQAEAGTDNSIDYASLVKRIDEEAILGHIKYLSGLGSRVSGSPGCNAASEYIYNYLKSLGLEVWYQEFMVTVPASYGAKITILSPGGGEITAYPLIPNLAVPVATPDEGVTGDLVYVGEGELPDFEGKKIRGSIVLMDFNSRRNWMNAAKFGAKAVIFIQPADTTYKEVEDKYVQIPFKFNRLYISAEDGRRLLALLEKGPVTVRVIAKSRWEERPTRNVIALLKGEREDIVQFSSYYDSVSVVIDLAPGAQEALGTSTLMEVARLLAQRKPTYTVLFTFFSGHDQALAGSRKFVEEFGYGAYSSIGKKIRVHINVDLSTGTQILTSFWPSPLSGIIDTPPGAKKGSHLMTHVEDVVQGMEDALGKKYFYSKEGSYWAPELWGRICPFRVFPNDHEPTIYAQGAAFTLYTADVRQYYNSPLDTFDRVNLENLKAQVELISGILYSIANLENLVPYYIKEWQYSTVRDINAWVGWSWILGKVAFFDYSVGWYTPIPNATVFVRYAYTLTATGSLIYGSAHGNILYTGLSTWMVDTTDEEGTFNITGINYNLRLNVIGVFAYKTDEDGNLIYAPDLGIHKFAERILAPAEVWTDVGYVALMKGGTIILMDAYDPETLQVPRDFSLNLNIYDFRTHALPETYGYSVWEHDWGVSTSIIALYIPPDTPVEIFARTSYALRYPLFVLTNSSKEHPEGIGYRVNPGEQLIINVPQESAKNLYWLDETRLKDLKRYNIKTHAFELHEKAGDLIAKAEEAMENDRYASAYNYSSSAWTFEKQVYLSCRSVMEDATTTIPIIALFLIIFAFFAEQLIFHGSGWKKFAVIFAVVAIGFIVLFLNHPSYIFASDISMIVLGVTVLILITPALVIVVQNFFSAVKALTLRFLGKHEISVYRVRGGFSQSFSISIRNINRHKVQSILVFMTITPVVISLVSLTSISTIPYSRPILYYGNAPYNGIVLQQEAYGNAWFGLNEQILGELHLNYGDIAIIAPRAWRYAPYMPGVMPFTIQGPGGTSATVRGLIGMTAQERYVTNVTSSLVAGDWFTPDTRFGAILTDFYADKLGIKKEDVPGAKISLVGVTFTVVGIIDPDKFFSIKDIDGGPLTPTDITLGPGTRTHAPMDRFLIIQYEDLLRLSGRIITVSMKFNPDVSPEEIDAIGRHLYDKYHLYTYVAYEGKTYLYSKGAMVSTVGMGTQLLPVSICALILMNLMIGIVKSRTKEIGIYSVVGVNPRQISVMFLAQAVTYAIVGGILGYLISMVLIANFAPLGLNVNYSSNWVLMAVGIAMATTIASTLYPMYLASKMVTPSLKRKWVIPTKPKGDDWMIPLPFVVEADEEAIGMINFMKEFLQHHIGETAELFSIRDLAYEEAQDESKLLRSLKMVMSLPPYELGMRQDTTFTAVKDLKSGKHSFEIHVHRLSGAYDKWMTTNRYIFDEFRKQLLLWRSLSPKDKETFMSTKPST